MKASKSKLGKLGSTTKAKAGGVKKGIGGAKGGKIKKSVNPKVKKAAPIPGAIYPPSAMKGGTQFSNTVNERKIPVKAKKKGMPQADSEDAADAGDSEMNE